LPENPVFGRILFLEESCKSTGKIEKSGKETDAIFFQENETGSFFRNLFAKIPESKS